MYSIKGKTFDYTWPILVRKVLNNGEEVLDERGSKTKELTNVLVEITEPESSEVPQGYPFSGQMIEQYEDQLLNPDKGGFVYTYGNRLRAYGDYLTGPYDQIESATKRLKKCGESRRAISVTWNPSEDLSEDEVPCMILVDFKIRKGKLLTTALWRSHDLFGAWPANMFALLKLSQKVAKDLNLEVGPIVVQSISLHIYEHNWQEADEI